MSLLDRAVALSLPLVPKPVVRHFSKRYIAGTNRSDAFQVVRSLVDSGAMATLGLLGEFITRNEEAEDNARFYQELIQGISAEKLPDTNVSVKLTAFGLLLDPHRCLDLMRGLLRTAEAEDTFVRIDMEDSQCTTETLEIYRTLRTEFPGRVGVVLQAYLRRTLDDVERLTGERASFRLCKGIYIEPKTIAYRDREEIRHNFALALDRMFERGAYVGIATHDRTLVQQVLGLIHKHGLDRKDYEFQMLLGVDEKLRRTLLDEGHRLRVYVPYGEHWYSYSLRRLRENPQIAGYAFKAIFKRS